MGVDGEEYWKVCSMENGSWCTYSRPSDSNTNADMATDRRSGRNKRSKQSRSNCVASCKHTADSEQGHRTCQQWRCDAITR